MNNERKVCRCYDEEVDDIISRLNKSSRVVEDDIIIDSIEDIYLARGL